jgi:hypothetical protein
MTIENYEEAKKLREEISRLHAIVNSLQEHDAELNIHQGYTVQIKRDSELHRGIMGVLASMIIQLETEFEKLGE